MVAFKLNFHCLKSLHRLTTPHVQHLGTGTLRLAYVHQIPTQTTICSINGLCSATSESTLLLKEEDEDIKQIRSSFFPISRGPNRHFPLVVNKSNQIGSDGAGFLLLAKEDRIPCGLTPTVAFLPPFNRRITLYPANSRGIRNFNPTPLLTWAVLINSSSMDMTMDIWIHVWACRRVQVVWNEPVNFVLFGLSSILRFLGLPFQEIVTASLLSRVYAHSHTMRFRLFSPTHRSPSALHRPLWFGWRRWRRMMINNKTGDQQRWIEDEKEKGKFILFSGGGERFRRKVAPQQGLPQKSHIQIGQCTDCFGGSLTFEQGLDHWSAVAVVRTIQ